MSWYREFREEIILTFPTMGNNALDPYFQANRESSMSIQSYGKEHSDNIYYEMMTEYIHNTLTPELVNKEVKTKVEFMKRYNINFVLTPQFLNGCMCLYFDMKCIRRTTALIVTKVLVLSVTAGILLTNILQWRGGCIDGFKLRIRKI